MFKPELKDTGWEEIPEVVFSISGDKYKESHEITRNLISSKEEKIATVINDELMDLMWEPTTVSELEEKLKDSLSLNVFNILGFRLELKESEYSTNNKGITSLDKGEFLFGWVHYKEDKKTHTFRFKISLDGEFSKC